MVSIGSLFAGIGGLELGLEWALAEAGIPHRVAWQVERDPFPRSVLARHWPTADRSVEDVCLAGSSNLAPVDLICGGFPCQDLSYAGKGAGIAEGTRSGLWFEYRRIVRELRPRIVVVENVSALLARGIDVVLGDLAALGYDAEWRCVRASDVGAPHRRERLFVVAHADEHGCGGKGPLADTDDIGRQLGPGASDERAGLAEPAHGGRDVPDSKGVGRAPMQVADRLSKSGAGAKRGRDRGLAQPRLGGAPHGLPPGMDRWPAGPGEAQHEWEAPRTAKSVSQRAARLKALGNAVVPQVAREVGRLMVIPLLARWRKVA